MGLFDFITGNADPATDGPRLDHAALYEALLAVRDPKGLWHVRRAKDEGRADLVAEWTMVDDNWREMFGASGERKTLSVLMRLDDEKATVRSVDHEVMLSWDVGLPHIAIQAAGFRGQKIEVGGSWEFGRKKDGSFGKTAEHHYSTNDLKEPLRKVVADAGWGWHGVAFAKL